MRVELASVRERVEAKKYARLRKRQKRLSQVPERLRVRRKRPGAPSELQTRQSVRERDQSRGAGVSSQRRGREGVRVLVEKRRRRRRRRSRRRERPRPDPDP